MIELGSEAPAGAAPVIEGSDATFMADVVEASKTAAIIVDFWAPWCGPCRQLTPALEAAVTASNGKARLVKINIDENPAIAGQLQVQSIPAVFGFVDGQPVDGFMGAQPASQIKEFVDRLVAKGGGGGLDEALDAADEMLSQGALADAAQTFAAILGEDEGNLRALGGLVRAYVASGDLDHARKTLAIAPEDKADDPFIAAARGAIDLAEATAGAGEVDDLRARLEANAEDHQTRYDLATALLAQKDNEGAVDELLDLFRRDREWNEGAAKTQLFKLFETFGPNDPLTLNGRRRLSSMIFA